MYTILTQPTVGIDFLAKNLTHRGKNYRLQLWDTAGQERFRSLIPSYLKDAHCALVVFDVTSKASFAETEMWVNLFNDNKSGDGFVLLLGNKIDLDYREISAEEAKQKVDKLGVRYL
jgi:Ras-related protein Rab-6A